MRQQELGGGDFAGRVVVLLGGGSGLGRAVARAVCAQGGEVILGGRTAEKLEETAAELGSQVSWMQVDTSDPGSLERFFSRVEHLDFLFNTTGDYVTGPLRELSFEEAESAFRAKFWGQYLAVKYALPKMAQDGAVVLMAGADGARPTVATPAYVACNAALEGLARGLAVELAPIRVNALSPGAMDGNFWSTRRPEEARREAFERYSRLNVLGRVGTEEEVARAVLFLFLNSYTTGTTLYVDGGLSMR
ncbi:SDR family NAD(P)-dependent oxidoreductase [Micromonospora qiuiae]|nr:SDR family oxidoreductase [Micromonospora qiuiae]